MLEAISNASPLIQLAKIEQLPLLRQLHPRVLIPNAVHREVVDAGKGRPGSSSVAKAEEEGWLVRTVATEDTVLAMLQEQLDHGEAEAIRVGLENPMAVVLLDDMAARLLAARMGLKVTGTLGLLLRAKLAGHISSLRPLIESLCDHGGFYIAPHLLAQALEAAGE